VAAAADASDDAPHHGAAAWRCAEGSLCRAGASSVRRKEPGSSVRHLLLLLLVVVAVLVPSSLLLLLPPPEVPPGLLPGRPGCGGKGWPLAPCTQTRASQGWGKSEPRTGSIS